MESNQTSEEISKDNILNNLIDILEDMTSDWDMEFNGKIDPDTKLIEDLAFESIDIVQLVVAIEECFKRRGMPFEELLMAHGRYVDEILVADAVDFIYRHLNK